MDRMVSKPCGKCVWWLEKVDCDFDVNAAPDLDADIESRPALLSQ